ncbi:hypothetical protein GYMLUDRAFT_238249 [Collybiopsis luxurians FD-317 M1]|nr:hypothetical protein GYMLUDRAFT_238249 [Collybiopsis luxurians FD-317 M1]
MFIISDVLSFLPASNAGLAPPLEVGQKLPPEVKEHLQKLVGPTMIYIPRHCGCPFPERDLHHLYTLLSQNLSMFESRRAQIIVLPHASTPKANQDWFDEVFAAAAAAASEPQQDLTQRIKILFHVIPDPAPDRTIAKSLSFGSLGFGGLLSRGPLGEAWGLRKLGIKNRETAAGSNRWLEHGAVWVSSVEDGSVVRWVEKPKSANGECDWMEGWNKIGIQL